ncbi:MAG: hypothetical protein ACFCUV_04700 [Rivularia sp. (in: cyanobacteria)]
MPAKKTGMRERAAMMSIRVDPNLYERYKQKLQSEGVSITNDIESHMRAFLGDAVIELNVVDVNQLIEDVERLKKTMGELQPIWQERMSDLKAS